MQGVQLLDGAIALVVRDEMSVLAENVTLGAINYLNNHSMVTSLPPTLTKLSWATGNLKRAKTTRAAYACRSYVFVTICTTRYHTSSPTWSPAAPINSNMVSTYHR